MHVKEQNTGKPDCSYLRRQLKEEPLIYTYIKNQKKKNMQAMRKNELTMLTEIGEKYVSFIYFLKLINFI